MLCLMLFTKSYCYSLLAKRASPLLISDAGQALSANHLYVVVIVMFNVIQQKLLFACLRLSPLLISDAGQALPVNHL